MYREAVALTLVAAALLSCTSERTLEEPDARPDGAFGGLRDGGTYPVPEVVCGGAVCPGPDAEARLDESPCCLPDDTCGMRARDLGAACHHVRQPGSVDLTCPELLLLSGRSLQGCCSPSGICGYYDFEGSLGCVTDTVLPDAATCVPSGNACTSIIELPCDGPEDCAGGSVCCGHLSENRYDRFRCSPTCEELSHDHRGPWLEICHVGETCQNPQYRCGTSPDLPSFLARCYLDDLFEAGAASPDASLGGSGVACDTVECGSLEKCCLRKEEPSSCAPQGAVCTCGEESD